MRFVNKSTVNEIRQRFDNEVERFSSQEVGQAAAMDSPLCLSLLSRAAAAVNPRPAEILDIGCGAGNFTLYVLDHLTAPPVRIRLIDLSSAMLERAEQRLRAHGFDGEILTHAQDVRDAELGTPDIVLASAVLHHLRSDAEWVETFQRIYSATQPGGSLWIYDLVTSEIAEVGELLWNRYGEYLTQLVDAEYREKVFAYIEKEDTPAPLAFQLDQLRKVGYTKVDVLHATGCFAAFGAVR